MQPRFGHLSLLFLFLAASPCSPQEQEHNVAGAALRESFLRCVAGVSPATADPSRIVHAPSDPSYPSLLNATIQNLRFASPRTPRPALLLTPATVAEARACVACCRRHGLTVRARSGGHDYEGLSYRSVGPRAAGARPFAVVDVAALRDVRVDAARREARVGPGATLGELYYAVARESRGALGFPAGICPTVCVGGHLSGGGFGPMMRKHGLAADNVVGAEVVDAEGRLLDRDAMGEGLFWALRGGGGGSFGVVVSWTVRLVPVPRVVSAFTARRVVRRGDQQRTQSTLRLLTKWQRVAHALPDDLFVKVAMEPELDAAGERHPLVVFKSLFLGNCSGMVAEMSTHLPELGVKPGDCRDMSWIQSMLYFYGYTNGGQPAEVLLDRSLQPKDYYKIKLDYLTSPIPAAGLAGLLDRVVEDRGGSIDIDPQGGAMGATPESATPYAHRRGYLYNVQYFVKWGGDANVSREDGHLGWVRGVHGFMAPYASSRPRAAYINFRDLDLGRNVEGETTYEAAREWGEMYFRGNFRRLAMVKAEVDPEQVFWSEQSIPPLLVADVAGDRQRQSE
ncbi:berberine bridge enzyme-like Cyn d 4 [Panicum virgatum]|uniref:FAD-binding PCMH-type domain-containing protein n=1 Tax=Panicum virgatum TaxID=38727 RepID=A0A8T0WX84_PANVG|nr:berberine bridge enzyme-like Cyn d 4 [Panicum virgatum]KAG2649734.1 hypothetical protein PVAP13_1NG127900 [Panicum virgatum]